LLAAGRRAILDQGLDAMTVDDVVRLAGLAKGSFYTYFSSRERFLGELRYALAEDIAAATRQAAIGSWTGLFRRVMSAARDWLVANEPLRGLFGVNYMADPERASKEPLLALLLDILEDGIAAGVIRPASGPRPPEALVETAQLMLDVMREASIRATAGAGDASIDAAEAFLLSARHFDAGAAASAAWPGVAVGGRQA
jgi:AcrR family transcriptional regulator